ncbi:hypothetical protein L5515_002227 [Caenorhabditis briggsae]|uniref:Uncharacterized protein n=1 Tax=Caenorhabditis briggsae TaxID=6238 RepID=A0AAE9E7H2_CAEBR|nr:hypothetical protein L5515_002227 [Caenorhabditis briggsae]
MPRTTHKEVRPFHGMGSNDTSSQERRVGEDDVPYAVKEMATLEDTSNVDFEMELEDMDKDEDTDEDDGGQTDLNRMIEEVSTPVLLFVTSNCISRLSNREFERLLTSQEDTFAEEARKLWYHYKTTVNQKWSPIGFAATQLYDMETGSAFDRETCERNIEKMIKNDRYIDYMEWLNLASKCREEGKDLLEKFSLGMATQTALSNARNRRAPRETKTVSNLVDNADELLVCYGSSQKANKYVPVNPSIFTKMSDYIIAGFGQTNSQDRKTQVISYLQSSLENKLNRVRARYNAKFGKSQSEQAAIWLHDELMKGEASELKSHPLNFNSSNKRRTEDCNSEKAFNSKHKNTID